jgi:hypothetical protein
LAAEKVITEAHTRSSWPVMTACGRPPEELIPGKLRTACAVMSQTLGTALGDWIADTGLGYEAGAVVFAAGLVVVVLLYYFTDISRLLLFWAAQRELIRSDRGG